MIKSIILFITVLFFANYAFTQTCLPDGVSFTYQQEIDDFSSNYPLCVEILGDVRIQETITNNITNLNGLSNITKMNGNLVIGNNNALYNLTGLNNLTSIEGLLWIENNSSLTNLSGLNAIQTIDEGVDIISNSSMESLIGLEGLSTTNDIYIGSNFSLNSLVGLDNLNNIDGEFWIEYNDNLPNLNGLENLSTIGGEFRVFTNASMLSLSGVSSLSSVDGTVYVGGNESLTNISDLNNIDNIGGSLWIGYNDDLTSLSGLNSINSVTGGLWIGGNNSLINLNGLNNLSDIGGYFLIEYNTNLENFNGLENLTTVGDLFWIGYNDLLLDISAISNLTYVGGDVSIGDNNTLQNLSGLNQLPELNGDLYIGSNYNFSSLSGLDNITSINGDIILSYNVNLTDLSAIEGLDPNGILSLSIYNNTNLSLCSIESICSYLDLPFSTTEIYDNATGCNSVNDINSNCSCSISSIISNIICNDSGTPTFPDDDVFTFDVLVTGNNTSNFWISDDSNNNSDEYNISLNFGEYLISEGDLNFTIYDSEDGSCTTDVFVEAPNTCSDQCVISAEVQNLICDDSGTPTNPDDDVFTFDVLVTGDNTSILWTSDDSNNNSGEYNIPLNFGEYPISEGDLNFIIYDSEDETCSIDIFVEAPNTCSDQCVISAEVQNIICIDNGTPTNPDDDLFTFGMLILGNNSSDNWISHDLNGNSGIYSDTVNFGNYPISGGELNFYISDSINIDCTLDVSVEAPSTCSSECEISALVSNILCNDNETPTDSLDDFFSFDLFVTGNNNGSYWIVDDYNNSIGEYDTTVNIGPFQISNGNVFLIVTDTLHSTCQTTIEVQAPQTCSGTCSIASSLINTVCDNNGTSSNSDDDIFTIKIMITGSNSSSMWKDDLGHSGAYGEVVILGPFNIIDGNFLIEFTDENNDNCKTTLMIIAPESCSEDCVLTTQLSNIVCDDNDTQAISDDDTFSFDILVTSENAGSSWSSNDKNSNTGSYNIVKNFGSYLITDGDLNFVISDIVTPNCSTNVNVKAPNFCSSGCPEIDIENKIILCANEIKYNLDSLIIESPEGKWNFVSGPQKALIKDDNTINILNFPIGSYFFSYNLNEIIEGCTESVIVELILLKKIQNSIIGNDNLCLEEDIVLSSENSFNSYHWSTGDTSRAISITDGGIYNITVTDDQNCVNSFSFEVNEWSEINANDDVFMLSKDFNLIMDVAANDKIEKIESLKFEIIESTQNGSLDMNNEGKYIYSSYELENNYSDEFIYKISNVYCENIYDDAIVKIEYYTNKTISTEMLLTPNGDGETETLVFKEISLQLAFDYPDNKLIVYNRWGDQVFSKNAYDNNWGGDYNGELLPIGVYFFALQLDQNKEEVIYGSILVLK